MHGEGLFPLRVDDLVGETERQTAATASVPRERCDDHPTHRLRRAKDLQEDHWIRRQRPLPLEHNAGDANVTFCTPEE